MKATLNFIIVFIVFSGYVLADEAGEKFTTILGIELGKLNLAQVQQQFGSAPLKETGDAGEYQVEICYKSTKGYISFLSGELGGNEHDLLGFSVSSIHPNAKCVTPLKKITDNLEVSGLRLGLPKEQFIKLISGNIKWQANKATIYYVSKRTLTSVELNQMPADLRESIKNGTQQNYLDVGISLSAIFKNGILTSYEVWKVETM